MAFESVTLVFDIGKTTKKALLFNNSFEVLEEFTERFSETSDDDGFASEDLSAVAQWVEDIFEHFTHHEKYNVTHVNFSAYGASFVHINKQREIAGTFYNYLKPCPEDCKLKFLSQHDNKNLISLETASPFLGFLNSGLQLFWLKHEKPYFFNNIEASLHLPQYFPFLLGGKIFCDRTSLGCHTMLWNFQNRGYHSWVAKENLTRLFPSIHPSDHTFEVHIHNRVIRMGIGVHDSSAALMPYLVTTSEPFLLLSTGTWNICFNPFNHQPLTEEELKKDCLCYLTWQGEPVKASRIFLGHEHELQQKSLAKYFGVNEEYYKTVAFNEKVYNQLAEENSLEKQFYPLGMEDTGPLPGKSVKTTNYAGFKNFEEAQHQLLRSLAQWQKLSVDLTDPDKLIANVIVVGGFTKSPLFLEIIKREIPERNFSVSDHPRATALGAAWLVHDRSAYQGKFKLLRAEKTV